MITITLRHKRPGLPRTRDKGPDLAALYADLYDRLHKAYAISQHLGGDFKKPLPSAFDPSLIY